MERFFGNVRQQPIWDDVVALRNSVFIQEQSLIDFYPEDEEDDDCMHLVYSNNGEVAASSRIRIVDGRGYIERICVKDSYRKQSLGRRLVKDSIDMAFTLGSDTATICAQAHLQSFYKSEGFIAESDPIQKFGIKHVEMIKYSDFKERQHIEKR